MATKVYFNNSCSICRFEINHYKKLENNLEWIDISTEKKSKEDTAKNAKELLRRLHTVKNNKVIVELMHLLKCGLKYHDIVFWLK